MVPLGVCIVSNPQQLSPALEDYLETILTLSEQERVVRVTGIAARLDIAKARVAQALSNLKKLKLITQDSYGPVWLTDKGREYADDVRRRHVTLMSFLVNVLGVDVNIAAKDACGMEHPISSISFFSCDTRRSSRWTAKRGRIIRPVSLTMRRNLTTERITKLSGW